MNSFLIRKALPEDLPVMLLIYEHARAFMAAHGNPRQWGPTNWPPEHLLREDIAAGKSYVCENDGRITGTFFYDFGTDIEPTYRIIEDGAWIGDDQYGVVHRIAVDGTVKGAGSFCIRWAFAQCGHLRIDTHGDNTVMQNLLSKLGFTRCGTIHVTEDNDPRIAYEKCSPESPSSNKAVFQSGKPQQDRAYLEMLKPILESMKGKKASEAAFLAGGAVSGDQSVVILRTFAKDVEVSLPSCRISPELENWHTLVLLHYLCNADGTLPAGSWMAFEDMRDGLIRGTKFDRSSASWFTRFLKGKTIEDMKMIGRRLGARIVPGKGDLCLLIPFLPHFPVLFSFWEADEDFEASGKLMVDRMADHYLSIEDAVTVGEIIRREMEKLS